MQKKCLLLTSLFLKRPFVESCRDFSDLEEILIFPQAQRTNEERSAATTRYASAGKNKNLPKYEKLCARDKLPLPPNRRYLYRG